VDVRPGVSVVRPFRLAVPEWRGHDLRFHTPFIESDLRVSRIRLSDKRSCLAHGRLRVSPGNRTSLKFS
jgi:hypothetical protein